VNDDARRQLTMLAAVLAEGLAQQCLSFVA
jgi:hypothetical protein